MMGGGMYLYSQRGLVQLQPTPMHASMSWIVILFLYLFSIWGPLQVPTCSLVQLCPSFFSISLMSAVLSAGTQMNLLGTASLHCWSSPYLITSISPLKSPSIPIRQGQLKYTSRSAQAPPFSSLSSRYLSDFIIVELQVQFVGGFIRISVGEDTSWKLDRIYPARGPPNQMQVISIFNIVQYYYTTQYPDSNILHKFHIDIVKVIISQQWQRSQTRPSVTCAGLASCSALSSIPQQLPLQKRRQL